MIPKPPIEELDYGSYNQEAIKKRAEWYKNNKSKRRIKVLQKNIDNEIIKIWNYLGEINFKETGFNKNRVSKACKENKKYKGYIWEYYKEPSVVVISTENMIN